MSMFGDMTRESHEAAEDRLGGFQVYDTDIYSGTIKLAYASQAPSGARCINFEFDFGGKTYKETVYYTNKKGENFFLNKDDKTKKVSLPGFTLVDDICLLTTETPLSGQATEEKVVNVYDRDAKKELPKSVPMLMDLLGKPISLGIVRATVNKTEKNSNGDYVPVASGETRDENNIDKAYHTETQLTVVEAQRELTKGEFWGKWVEANKGKTRDKTVKNLNTSGNAGRPGNGPPQSSANSNTPGAAPARKSLFGAKG